MRDATFESHPLARRLRFLAWVFPLLVMCIVGVVLFVLFIVGTGLIFVTVGIPLALTAVWLNRRVGDMERWILRTQFGIAADSPYRPWPRGHVGVQLIALSKDITVWRDLAWRAVNMTLGVLVYVFYLSLLGGAIFSLIQPFLFLGFPGVFNTYFGVIRFEAFMPVMMAGLVVSLLYLGLWWWVGDLILYSYAKLAGVLLRPTKSAQLEKRVVELTESRAETVDASAAELRRIERDLHDGAQARLVALGMSLGMAEEILKSDPDAASALLTEARENSSAALAEIRDLVRGIHPPVLADRGLTGAVEALALSNPLPVTVDSDLPGRAPAPVESAAYFAVAEALTNAAKYARASQVRVRIGHFGTPEGSQVPRLGVTVRDDGGGGAVITPGGGLDGVVRRIGVFDGSVTVQSPQGGPTVIALEIPCELSGDVAESGDTT